MKYLVALLAITGLCYAADENGSVTRNLEILPNLFRQGRIVNGQPAAANQFPHQALVFIQTFQGSFQCGGSLISSLWVLNAAHCIIGSTGIEVLLGSTNRNFMPVKRNGVQAIHMTSYNPNTVKDDIALIQMNREVTFSPNVQAIQLPPLSQDNATLLNDILTVSGFGLTTSNRISSNLQYANVIGISNTKCRDFYGSIVIPTMLCARGYPNENAGSCSGDSGGPLIKNSTNPIVVGIVSFGAEQSCTAGFPQGFTRVASYLKWISSLTGIQLRK